MSMRFAPLLLALGAGCESDCHATCEKLFGDGEGQCNIQIPGMEGESGREEMVDRCVDHCRNAMRTSGEVGDYDPTVQASGSDDVALENRAQAQLWVDCVAETSCESLDKNFCAPIKNFP